MNTISFRNDAAHLLSRWDAASKPDANGLHDGGGFALRNSHDIRETLRGLYEETSGSADWRVLGGVIPGPIPAEWARQGDTIRDNGVTGTITRIVNTGRMVHLYIDSGHVCFAKVVRQDWVHVTAAGEAE